MTCLFMYIYMELKLDKNDLRMTKYVYSFYIINYKKVVHLVYIYIYI